jgi:ribonuclease HII
MLKVRYNKDSLIEAGVDESGRGPLWGPLYAAAVIWVPEEDMSAEQLRLAPLIKDSKKVSAKKRVKLAEEIKNHALSWGIGSVSAKEIDELGMTKSNQLVFERALANLSVTPERLIIDGCLSIYNAPWSMIPQVVEPEADGNYLPVAAASILAKVAHDEYITEFCELNENISKKYDLLNCKGYGTKKHRDGIMEFGIHELHRRLFLRKMGVS